MDGRQNLPNTYPPGWAPQPHQTEYVILILMDKTRSFVVAVPYLAHGPKGQRVLVIDFTCSGSSVPLCYITTIALATSWLINQLHHYTAMHPTHQYCSFDVQDQLWCCKRYPFKFSWSLKVSLSLLSWAISESRIHLDFSLNEIKPINMEGTTSELPPSRIAYHCLVNFFLTIRLRDGVGGLASYLNSS